MVLEDRGAACHPVSSFPSFCICRFQPKASENFMGLWRRASNGRLLYFYPLKKLRLPVGAVKLKLSQGPVLIRESAQGTHLYLRGQFRPQTSKTESLDQVLRASCVWQDPGGLGGAGGCLILQKSEHSLVGVGVPHAPGREDSQQRAPSSFLPLPLCI